MDEFVACVSISAEGGLPIYAFLSICEIRDPSLMPKNRDLRNFKLIFVLDYLS